MFISLFRQLKSEESINKKLEILFYDRSFRKLIIQLVFSFFMILFLFYLISRAFSLDLGFGHLSSRAGFGISHTFLVEYSSNDSRWQSYIVGIINTIRVSFIGILLATTLGVFMGLARLSKNFLINKISAGYVEFIRNTPLLIQIIFWQLILLQLPQISEALTFGGLSVWSNRGILLPFVNSIENGSLWFLVILISLIISLFLRSYLNKYREENVNFFSPSIISSVFFISIAAVTYFIMGIELYADVPSLEVNEYGTYIQSGGFLLSPEFAAILFALVLYTGTFITEISDIKVVKLENECC